MNNLNLWIEEKEFDGVVPDFTSPKRSEISKLFPMEIWFEIVKNFTTGDFEAFRKCNFEAYEIVTCFQKAWREKVLKISTSLEQHEFAILKYVVKVNFKCSASSSTDLKRIAYSEFCKKIFRFQACELIQISRVFPKRKEKTVKILEERVFSAESYLEIDQLIQDLNLLTVYYKGQVELLSGNTKMFSEYIKVDFSDTSTEEKISRLRAFITTNDLSSQFVNISCLSFAEIGLTRVPLEFFKDLVMITFDYSGNYIWKLPVISKGIQEKLSFSDKNLSFYICRFKKNLLYGAPASLNVIDPDDLSAMVLTNEQVTYFRARLVDEREIKESVVASNIYSVSVKEQPKNTCIVS